MKGFNNLIAIDFVINTNTYNINTNKFCCSDICIKVRKLIMNCSINTLASLENK